VLLNTGLGSLMLLDMDDSGILGIVTFCTTMFNVHSRLDTVPSTIMKGSLGSSLYSS
jgi:hypothetical protein